LMHEPAGPAQCSVVRAFEDTLMTFMGRFDKGREKLTGNDASLLSPALTEGAQAFDLTFVSASSQPA
jgi:hypothetical protein